MYNNYLKYMQVRITLTICSSFAFSNSEKILPCLFFLGGFKILY